MAGSPDGGAATICARPRKCPLAGGVWAACGGAAGAWLRAHGRHGDGWQAGVNGGVKCTVKRAGLEAEKSTQKRAHFVAGCGVKNGLKMGLDGQLGGQMGGRFVQATTPLRENKASKTAKNEQKHPL